MKQEEVEDRTVKRPLETYCFKLFSLAVFIKLVLHSSDSLKFSFSGPLIATNQKLGYPNPVCKCVLFDLYSVFKTSGIPC